MRPSQSSHPCAVSMTVSPFSSWRAWQSLSLQQEIGYQSWASTRAGAIARKASASGHARTQVMSTSLVVAGNNFAEANGRARSLHLTHAGGRSPQSHSPVHGTRWIWRPAPAFVVPGTSTLLTHQTQGGYGGEAGGPGSHGFRSTQEAVSPAGMVAPCTSPPMPGLPQLAPISG
jgi:hypothetical protein